jgi:hypothetical protein
MYSATSRSGDADSVRQTRRPSPEKAAATVSTANGMRCTTARPRPYQRLRQTRRKSCCTALSVCIEASATIWRSPARARQRAAELLVRHAAAFCPRGRAFWTSIICSTSTSVTLDRKRPPLAVLCLRNVVPAPFIASAADRGAQHRNVFRDAEPGKAITPTCWACTRQTRLWIDVESPFMRRSVASAYHQGGSPPASPIARPRWHRSSS